MHGLVAEPSASRHPVRSAIVAYGLLASVLTAIQTSMLGLRDASTIGVTLLINLFVGVMIGTAIDLGHTAMARVFDLERRSTAVRLVVSVGVVGLAVVIGVESGVALVGVAWPRLAAGFPRLGVLYVAIPVTIVMVAISRERERMHARAAEAERDAEVRTRQALRAELSALQSRTNPHFLFNALNTIAALIAEEPAVAERAVERLAALLRFALASGRQSSVPLRDELAATTEYIELERLRFGERLQTTIEIDQTLLDVHVPPLSLQPLVENAVLHAVAARRGPTTIELWVRRTEAGIELGVRDDGPGDGNHHGTGTAQADLRARLQLMYGNTATLEAGVLAKGGYSVVMRLPEAVP